MDDMEFRRTDGSVIAVGDRIVCEESLGTVCFIGDIPSTKGCWVGIEWDDPSRGKHDGQHNGVNYFKTSHPTGGSFVRPKKIDGGVSCYDAIQSRYGEVVGDEDSGVITEELFVVDKNNKRTMVEMIGAKSVNLKQSQLKNLREVVLRDMTVYGVGQTAADLKQETQNIREIDLSHNLLTSWQSVAEITKCLPCLRSLFVSENRLAIPSDTSDLEECFQDLTALYINKMNYTWQQILSVSSMFRSLQQIHACFNSLQALGPVPSGSLENLTLLNLESNHIKSWSQLMHCSSLPRLEELIVIDNEIDEVMFSDVGPTDKTKHFPRLRTLCLNHNKIASWSSINELNKLRSLEELRITHNPLLDSTTPETARQLFVAKLSNLKLCNRTEVTDEERKGAEIDYLKRYGPDWLKSGGCQDSSKSSVTLEFKQQHPRFEKLIKDYGAPENSEMKQKSKTLKDNLISVYITSPHAPEKGTLEKKLPITMSVSKLKALAKRLFKLDVLEIYLSYSSHKNPDYPEIEFENDLRQLSFYSIEPGDTIIVKYR